VAEFWGFTGERFLKEILLLSDIKRVFEIRNNKKWATNIVLRILLY